MEVLVAVETLVLVLMALLVAGLLRSHAEILRRLEALDGSHREERGADGDEHHVSAPHREVSAPAPDVAGSTLRGEPVKIGIRPGGPSTLVAFLSSGCATCRTFWEGLGPGNRPGLPVRTRLVVVTKDSSHESPSRLRELAPPDVPVVMSSSAWEDYEVPASPYFVYVDGRTGRIQGEGTAEHWEQVFSLLRDALADSEESEEHGARPLPLVRADGGRGGRDRADRVDRELAAAGISDGHPSLYAADDLSNGRGRP